MIVPKVAKSLRNNLPKPLLSRAERLISLVESAIPWVKQWVGPYRDTIAHYRSIESSGFVGIPDEKGHLRFFPPTDRTGAPLTEIATLLFGDLVAFCEEFLICAYRIQIPEAFQICVADERGRDAGLQIKFVLRMKE